MTQETEREKMKRKYDRSYERVISCE